MEVGISQWLQKGIGFFHPPIPVRHCIRLTANLPSAAKELNRLTTFRPNNRMGYLPTGKAGVLPIYRKNNPARAGCLQITCLHPVFLPFWPMCVNNFHIFAHDGTSTAVYFCSPYHPSRHLSECCYPSGNLIPAASHPNPEVSGPLTHVPAGYP